MNQIGPTLSPAAAAPTMPGDSESATSHAPEGAGTFASLLQQRAGEPVEASESVAVFAPEAEPVTPDKTDDAVDALLSAGLFAMFGLPVVAPLSVPVRMQPLEGVGAHACADIGSAEIPVASSKISSSEFAQPADISSIAPFASAPSKTTPATIREVAALAQPKDPPLPNVATVRGILPPLQSAIPLPVTEIAPRMAIPAPTVSIESADQIGPAIPATTPGTVPAPFTGKAEQPTILENKTPTPEIPAPSAPPATVQISQEVAPITRAEILGGMVAAKPGHAMSAPSPTQSPRPTAAIPAEVSALGEVSVVASPALRHALVVAAENGSEQSPGKHSENPETPLVQTPDFLQPQFSSEPMPVRANPVSTTRIQPTDVAQVVAHTLAATERLRTSKQERIEVALKLEGGQELTIQLRVANGQVTPTIRTGSEPLRLALEENWAQFAQRSGEGELQITRPIFESPQTSSNLTDLNQQRDGRQRAFQESASTFAQPYLPRRHPTTGTAQPIPPISTPQTGVRLYA